MSRVALVIIGVILFAGVMMGAGCQEASHKMTAPEVCQYVNQALPVQYVGELPTKYEYQYNAMKARHIEGGMWEVDVKVTKETQWFRRVPNGEWVLVSSYQEEYIKQYYFSENTGAVKAR